MDSLFQGCYNEECNQTPAQGQPMELNLYALKTFREVVDQRSFSKTAAKLYLSQPAVSLQIQALENYFQVPLLVREKGRIKLTQEGRTVYDYAGKLEKLKAEFLQSMDRHADRIMATLRLGTCFIAGEYLFPDILKSLQTEYPDTRVALSVLKCEKIFQGLLDGILDLGITGVKPQSKALQIREIGRAPLVLFQSPNNALEPGPVSIRDLMDTPVVLREEGAGIHKEFSDFLKSHSLTLKNFRHVCLLESNQAIKSMVRAGMGFSLMPEFMVRQELQSNEVIPIELKEGGLKQGFYMVYRQQESLPELMNRLIEYIALEIFKIISPAEQKTPPAQKDQ